MSALVANVLAGAGNDGDSFLDNMIRQFSMGFPILILIQRWLQKYPSLHLRGVLLTFAAGFFFYRQLKGVVTNFFREYMMSTAEVGAGDEVHSMLLSVSENCPCSLNMIVVNYTNHSYAVDIRPAFCTEHEEFCC